MPRQSLLETLTEKNIISDAQAAQIKTSDSNQSFSIHWELRLLLYLGIMLLSTGLGFVIYENIDTIGHNILIGLVGLVCVGCFYYAFSHRKPFSWEELEETTNLDDFALLGGCLAFLTLEGYLQYQYSFFGTRYGLAAFLPAVLFFFCAYYFDHRGVLSMAITALASWIGISITPLRLLKNNDFNSQDMVITAILLGLFLITVGWVSIQKNLKKHFSFTYFVFGGNLTFIAALSGLFALEFKLIYGSIIAILAYLSIKYARIKHSYLFLLMGVIYGYIGFTYVIFEILPNNLDPFMYMLYFMLSGAGVVLFLIKIKEIVGLKK
ncbi:MAG: DUF2157 domain-containing protein [Emticicia sp.]|uniref:DUF2157 domain-containing protein n=1 Tax=Emticicia sp. TaxID=1930953 RepID=UPI003BA48A42